jgi:hypothetical protein
MSNVRGFIVDVPNVLITTTSGDTHIVNASQGEVKFGGESLTVAGGWSFYDLTEIDTKKTIDISITDGIWNLDTLKLASGGTVTVKADTFYEFGTKYEIGVAATPTITIPYVVVASSVRINNFTETTSSTPTATQFLVTISATDTVITFNSSVAETDVYPAYLVATLSTDSVLEVQTTDFPSSGVCILTFPVYADPESTEANIVGYGQFTIYKAKIKADFTAGGSYKQASSFAMTLKGLDPRRADGNMWKFVYKAVAA